MNEDLRYSMVEEQIRARGITNPAVLAAMAAVPRECFVRPGDAELAYADCALQIDEGQTISQPFIVALMAEAAGIGPSSRVLEVGTGSGYGAAVLGEIAAAVWTVERYATLAGAAGARLAGLAYFNVHVHVSDGGWGWPEAAPFDAILVTAAAPAVPGPLLAQLAPGGRLVIPVGLAAGYQELRCVRRVEEGFDTRVLTPVRFVPLVGGVAEGC